jgi:hypothetical protein
MEPRPRDRLRHRDERDHLVTFLRLAGSRSDIVPCALGALLLLELAISSNSGDRDVTTSVTFRSRFSVWRVNLSILSPVL